jgi:very-short-patch-repair endonuclease
MPNAPWTLQKQVGCSSYRIDLAVVDPERPGSYLLGIECDGANYHSARTARDRDRLRAHVLTRLGWRLERVWSTDWWVDAEAEIERLNRAIDDAVARRPVPAPPVLSAPARFEPRELTPFVAPAPAMPDREMPLVAGFAAGGAAHVVSQQSAIAAPSARTTYVVANYEPQLYEKLDASSIALLGTHHIGRSFLDGNRRLCGLPVEAIADDGSVSPGALRYSTPRRFKGLEADVVLLCDVDGLGHACTNRDIYVSMSRARHRLYVFSSEGYRLRPEAPTA